MLVANKNAIISDLRASVSGRVITPDDAEYDEARSVFYGGIDRRRAVIARVANAQGVSRVVRVARQTGMGEAIRSGGHSVAGHGVCAGGIVLDRVGMKGVEVDADGRPVWAETGLPAGEVSN